MKYDKGSRVYVRSDGDCEVLERIPFRDQSALLRVRRLSDSACFHVEECAVIDSHLAAKEALR